MSPVTETARGALADATIHREWVAAYRTPEAQKFYATAFDELLREVDAPAGATFLDTGCGSCAKSILLAGRGMRVVGTNHYAGQIFGQAVYIGATNANTVDTVIQGNTIGLAADAGLRASVRQ